MRVLIAEDDAVSRMTLRRAVEKFGHECLTAADGIEAWEIYRKSPEVDVIISDWMMPGMSGPSLCEKVRGLAGREGYPFFVFLTALGDKEHLLAGMRAGADDYLAKPLNRDELQARLLAASRVTSLHRQLAEQKRELEQLNFELFKQARRDPLTRLAILPEQTLKSAAIAANRLRHAVEGLKIPHEASKPGLVTVSRGLAELAPEGENPVEELLREADDALYRAKASSKNRVAR